MTEAHEASISALMEMLEDSSVEALTRIKAIRLLRLILQSSSS